MIKPILVDGEQKNMYIDGTLGKELEEHLIPSIRKKDKDVFMLIDGEEGSGKSVLAFQVAKFCSPKFTVDNIAFNAEDFHKIILKAEKYDCVVYDEAFTGLSSRSVLSKTNKKLIELAMLMRQKNLFVIIVLPSIFMLDPYISQQRSKCLFHVYEVDGHRGYWCLFNKQSKQLLVEYGKKNKFQYNYPRADLLGRFYETYTINEAEYRKRKLDHFKSSTENTENINEEHIWLLQRDALMYYLNEVHHVSTHRIGEVLTNMKLNCTQQNVSRGILNIKKRISQG